MDHNWVTQLVNYDVRVRSVNPNTFISTTISPISFHSSLIAIRHPGYIFLRDRRTFVTVEIIQPLGLMHHNEPDAFNHFLGMHKLSCYFSRTSIKGGRYICTLNPKLIAGGLKLGNARSKPSNLNNSRMASWAFLFLLLRGCHVKIGHQKEAGASCMTTSAWQPLRNIQLGLQTTSFVFKNTDSLLWAGPREDSNVSVLMHRT